MNLIKLFARKKRISDMRLRAACGCHQGKRRKNNEDNFYFDGMYMDSNNHGLSQIKEKELSVNDGAFFCVFDGMGGGDFGEVASYTAATTTNEFLHLKTNRNTSSDITLFLEQLCETVNKAVFKAGQKLGSSKMGSTLVGLYFHAGKAWVCNLGDSRCYLFRNRKMRQISEDHTDEKFMKENGITGRKPYLIQFLGIDPGEMKIVPYIKSYDLDHGDRFLICSDGITDMIEEQEICGTLAKTKDPSDCVRLLIQKALDRGGKDNITAIVLDIV